MAACDNLYGNLDQWKQLHDFIKKEKPEYLPFMLPMPTAEETRRICYIPEIQGWLLKNCPFAWVQKQLNTNCEIQTLILGKAHHE